MVKTFVLTLPHFQANSDRVPLEEMKAAEEKGAFSYIQPRKDGDKEEEQFEEAQESQTNPLVRIVCSESLFLYMHYCYSYYWFLYPWKVILYL